jgi:signal transduction histidine kinase
MTSARVAKTAQSKRSGKPAPLRRKSATAEAASAVIPMTGALSAEEEETLHAIRAGQVDALVIRESNTDQVYALRSFVEIQRTQTRLKSAGAARRRSEAQLRTLAEERERLFQDLHDGCIQSVYAARLNLEACLPLMATDPKKATRMIAECTVALNLVIQELRSFINGHRLQIAGEDLSTHLQTAARAAANHGLDIKIDIDADAMAALTSAQAFHVLQIVREGISNASRHAAATTGRVSLRKRRGSLCLEIVDDGSGFVARKVNKFGLGLHHIQARARKLGGAAKVQSSPHRGTRITVTFGKA